MEQPRTVLARLSQARELIQAAGASKFSEVDPSKFWAVGGAGGGDC